MRLACDSKAAAYYSAEAHEEVEEGALLGLNHYIDWGQVVHQPHRRKGHVMRQALGPVLCHRILIGGHCLACKPTF